MTIQLTSRCVAFRTVAFPCWIVLVSFNHKVHCCVQFRGTFVSLKNLRGARKESEMELLVMAWTTVTTCLCALGLAP
jgi:hypothetical protein